MPLVALFHSLDAKRCHEYNLVLQAMGVSGQIVEYERRYYLLVEEPAAPIAYQQLQAYISENTPDEKLTHPLQPFAKGYIGGYVYAFMLSAIGACQVTYSLGLDWYAHGVAHSEKILNGEWWRSITALSLHADVAHLTGNLGFGVLFGLLVAQYIGNGGAWLMILVSGAVGNYLNAYLYSSLHLSIGASTMVFAALGILGVFALNDRYSYAQRGIRRWLPLIATLGLLALTGTGGERTDVLAHLAGYFCGCISAILWIISNYFITRQNAATPAVTRAVTQTANGDTTASYWQKAAAAMCFVIVFGAWLLAFNA